jgi:hypothetical protein
MAPDIFYMCDPEKNKICPKTSCYYNPLGIPRECRMTSNREFAANGTRYRFDEKTGEWNPIPLDLDLAHAMTPEEISDIIREAFGVPKSVWDKQEGDESDERQS